MEGIQELVYSLKVTPERRDSFMLIRGFYNVGEKDETKGGIFQNCGRQYEIFFT